LKFLEEHQVNLNIRNMGIESMVEGKPNSTFSLILQIMAAFPKWRRSILRSAPLKVRAVAVAKGVKMGRKEGSNETREKFLKKHDDIQRMLNSELSVRDIAKLTGKAPSTVQRVKSTLKEMKKR
jgi:DNA invertase Pin-like site-specific DNA recombinase